MIVQKNQTLLFVGDSITDAGRRSPEHAPYGRGYVDFFRRLQIIREPEKPINIINRGVGGNTAEDLRSRWHEDVLLHRPDVLSIKIGINDTARSYNQPEVDFLKPEGFRAIYDQLLSLTREALPDCRLLLITPFYLSMDTVADSYRHKMLQKLSAYIEVVEAMAEKWDARYLNLHEIFQKRLRSGHHPDVYSPEPVHPNPTGHLLIAESIWEALR